MDKSPELFIGILIWVSLVSEPVSCMCSQTGSYFVNSPLPVSLGGDLYKLVMILNNSTFSSIRRVLYKQGLFQPTQYSYYQYFSLYFFFLFYCHPWVMLCCVLGISQHYQCHICTFSLSPYPAFYTLLIFIDESLQIFHILEIIHLLLSV